MCSYNTPAMLFPPIEMLYLASIAREWHQASVSLIDSIAENLGLEEVCGRITAQKPNMIVCLTGFEIVEDDIRHMRAIKDRFPHITLVVFGHYATNFPAEILLHSKADYVLQGEPDINFSNLLDHISGKITREEMKGVYYADAQGQVILHEGAGRIKKPEELPLPAHDLLQIDMYNEPFLPKPFALIQSARGCPYACNFCVRSYGTRLALRSPESIVEEIRLLVSLHQIRSFRFIDDTFTATSKRVIRFCQLLVESGIRVKWTCLSRADTLNEEMIGWMKKAGCTRVYIGIESGSPRILHLIDKDIDLEKGLDNIRILQRYGIETTAFYMVGYPEETEDDFRMSMEYARRCNFDYVIIGRFIPYPGTVFFDKNRHLIDFSIFPYKNEFKDKELIETGIRREKEFYRNYYFRPGFAGKIWKNLIGHPVESLSNVFKAIRFQFADKDSHVRNDYI
jgi:anaerobic magnesium-protoporphyrin IX monomethyl ester cyclase